MLTNQNRRPPPSVTRDNAFYWEGAGREELLIQDCGRCGVLCHPPAPLCPSCHSPQRTVRQMAGLGRLTSFIVIHHPPVPSFDLPIVVGTVELIEGPSVTTNICNAASDELELGMPVEVFFAATTAEALGIPLFRPVRM